MLALSKGKGFQAVNARLRLIAIHMAEHREPEGRAQAAAFLKQRPTFTLRHFKKVLDTWPFRDRSWIPRWVEHLRRAGLPDE